jgi:hypothetical protein
MRINNVQCLHYQARKMIQSPIREAPSSIFRETDLGGGGDPAGLAGPPRGDGAGGDAAAAATGGNGGNGGNSAGDLSPIALANEFPEGMRVRVCSVRVHVCTYPVSRSPSLNVCSSGILSSPDIHPTLNHPAGGDPPHTPPPTSRDPTASSGPSSVPSKGSGRYCEVTLPPPPPPPLPPPPLPPPPPPAAAAAVQQQQQQQQFVFLSSCQHQQWLVASC